MQFVQAKRAECSLSHYTAVARCFVVPFRDIACYRTHRATCPPRLHVLARVAPSSYTMLYVQA